MAVYKYSQFLEQSSHQARGRYAGSWLLPPTDHGQKNVWEFADFCKGGVEVAYVHLICY